MQTTVISGAYYDMGYKLGSQFKHFFKPPPCHPEKLKLYLQCREFVKKYTPDLLEEIRGFCDAGNFNLEIMEAFLLVLGYELFHPPEGGCTVFAVGSELTESGFPIFARNYDFNIDFQQYCGMTFRAPLGKLKSIAFSDHMIGNMGGINESGLAIAILLAGDYDGKWQPGIRVNLSTRWVMDNCHNTEEAVSFLEKIPHVRGHIFMVIDKEDNMARVETSPPHVAVTYAKKDYLFSTNHYQAESLKKYSNQTLISPNSLERFNKVKTFLEKRNSNFTLNNIMEFLSSHEVGVCNHFESDGIKTATIYSWIAEILEKAVPIQTWATIGSPCKNDYESYTYF
ncbi:MAG: C45 family autoproteolytic acyltransferase/hydrolase [Candidatus Hodarchaeota archaeon]